MTSLKFVGAMIARRPVSWLLHLSTLALGIAVVASLSLVDQAIERRFQRDLGGVDLVIGAKGSPLQIVLSALFQLDAPTGNVPLTVWTQYARNPFVKQAVPLSLGDSVHGARIVGTVPAYAALYGADLENGRWWSQPMQAVVGAEAARRLHLDLGTRFVGQHGLTGGEAHAEHPFIVVGVLKPTGSVIDRLVLTDLRSIWTLHEHAAPAFGPVASEPQVTAVLIRYRSAMGNVLLPTQVSHTPDLQPASPAVETARLINLLGLGSSALKAVGLALLVLAAAGFVVALASAVSQRRRELALLLSLGAQPGLLMRLILLEGAVLGLLGGAVGVLVAHGLLILLVRSHIAEGAGALAPPPIGALDGAAVFGAVLLALLAAMGPGLMALRTDPSRELARG